MTATDDAVGIELDHLTKVYPGRTDANGEPLPSVDDISLSMPPGEVFGLLGPNGAGKSTTIRMIATLLTPTSGSIRVHGLDVATQQNRVRSLLGVALGGERSVYWKLTGRQNLEYFMSLHGRSRRRSRSAINEVLEGVGLSDRADDYVEDYSTGMRQRLVIARALLNRPQVLLLDEPASGLDPRAAEDLHDQVRRLRAAGHTIVLTTHDMIEADALSDRIAVIDHGRVVAEGRPIELKRSLAVGQTMRAHVRFETAAARAAFAAGLGDSASIGEASDSGTVEVALSGGVNDDLLPGLVAMAAQHGGTVVRVENELAGLKDVFLSVVAGRDGRGADQP